MWENQVQSPGEGNSFLLQYSGLENSTECIVHGLTTLMAETKELKSLLMKVKEEGEKVDLKLTIQKTKIMASSQVTSWPIDVEMMKTVRDFILGGSKITTDGDCSHEIKRCLLLERKAMTNLDSTLKIRDTYFTNKGPSSQSYGFTIAIVIFFFMVAKYGCESWTIKTAECQRIDAF